MSRSIPRGMPLPASIKGWITRRVQQSDIKTVQHIAHAAYLQGRREGVSAGLQQRVNEHAEMERKRIIDAAKRPQTTKEI